MLITELWFLDGMEPSNVMNLEMSFRFQTILRVLTMSLRHVKNNRDTMCIIKMIHRLFSNFIEIQISTGLCLLANVKRTSVELFFKHVFGLIKVTTIDKNVDLKISLFVKVIDNWSFDGFNCARLSWKQMRGMLFNQTRIRPHFTPPKQHGHYFSHDSYIPMLVSSL